MKSIAVAFFGMLLFTCTVSASEVISFSMEIENENDTVSPGGYLKIKIIGSSNKKSSRQQIDFSVDTDDVVEWRTHRRASEIIYKNQNVNIPRYAKAKIKSDLDIALPKTVTLTAKYYVNGEAILVTAPFYIKEGTYGYPSTELSGKYHKTIMVGEHDFKIKYWYEIFCISSKTGHCSINIKNGVHDRYNGLEAVESKHKCADAGYPGTSRLDIRSPLIFDARKLIVEQPAPHTSAEGHLMVDYSACRFISDNPIMIRHIHNDSIPSVTP